MTVQVRDFGYCSSSESPLRDVSLPAPPWSIETGNAREETAPDPRITLCNPAKRGVVESAYTRIMRAIKEVGDDI